MIYNPLDTTANRILLDPASLKTEAPGDLGLPLTQTCARCGAQAVVKLADLGGEAACYCNACHVIGTRLVAKAMALGIEVPRWTHPDSPTGDSAEVLARRMDRLTRWLAVGIIPLLAILIVRNLPGLRDLPWWP